MGCDFKLICPTEDGVPNIVEPLFKTVNYKMKDKCIPKINQNQTMHYIRFGFVKDPTVSGGIIYIYDDKENKNLIGGDPNTGNHYYFIIIYDNPSTGSIKPFYNKYLKYKEKYLSLKKLAQTNMEKLIK